jgi:hypothetical protein
MSDAWCVVVFKCKPETTSKFLVEFYRFVKDIEGVKSLHFIIRDRVDNEVVFSFRVLVDAEKKLVVKSKMAYKLGSLMPEEKFAIDPNMGSSFERFVGWLPEDWIARFGEKKFSDHCVLLGRLSELVVQMAKRKHFGSSERVELAHAMSWMLGCAEYGLLNTMHWEIGYYDRIENKNYPYLKEEFPKP